jgi:thermostable 8-oxoguanine DNA glycosylase
MEKFIECLIDKNFSVLGKGNEIKLQAAWIEIFNEFSSLRQNSQSNEIFELMKSIFSIEQKIKIINSCVEILWHVYNRELANELKDLGFNIKLDWSNKTQYIKELQSVISKGKSLTTKLKQKQAELDKLTEKQKGNSWSRKDFVSINTNLARFMNFHINNSLITVADWCDMVNKYEAYCEAVNAEKNNMLTRR